MAEPERLILIDGHSLIYRSYFAFQGSRNQGAVEFTVRRTGEIVTAVYGFTSVFLSILDDLKPEYAAIALDAPAKTFRHEKDAQYKATRVSMPDELRRQAARIREVIEAFHMPTFEVPGLRGRRRHRHAREAGEGRRHPGHDRHARHRPPPARRGGRRRLPLPPVHEGPAGHHLRRARRRREVRLPARPRARLQGPEGRPLRQHPRRPRHRREDGDEAHPGVGHRRGDLPPHREGHAREAAREAARERARRPPQQGAGDHHARSAGRAEHRGLPPPRLRPRRSRRAVPLPRVPQPHPPPPRHARQRTPMEGGRPRPPSRRPRRSAAVKTEYTHDHHEEGPAGAREGSEGRRPLRHPHRELRPQRHARPSRRHRHQREARRRRLHPRRPQPGARRRAAARARRRARRPQAGARGREGAQGHAQRPLRLPHSRQPRRHDARHALRHDDRRLPARRVEHVDPVAGLRPPEDEDPAAHRHHRPRRQEAAHDVRDHDRRRLRVLLPAGRRAAPRVGVARRGPRSRATCGRCSTTSRCR